MKRLLIPFFFLFLIFLPSYGNTEDKNWQDLSDETELRKIFIEKSELKDPFSIQFRRVKVGHLAQPENIVWCGEVNAKNSYGGYVGWNLFFAYNFSGETKVTIDSDIAHDGFLLVMELYCAGSGIELKTSK